MTNQLENQIATKAQKDWLFFDTNNEGIFYDISLKITKSIMQIQCIYSSLPFLIH